MREEARQRGSRREGEFEITRGECAEIESFNQVSIPRHHRYIKPGTVYSKSDMF